MARPTGLKAYTYEPHPVPESARRFPHIATYFAAEGGRNVGGLWTGTEVAADLTRNLLPAARRSVLGIEVRA